MNANTTSFSAMDVRKVLGENVRKVRVAAGLSQEELALRIQIVDQAYISGLESGKRNPTAILLWLIASSLDVDIGKLFSTEGMDQEWARGPIKIISKRSGRRNIKAHL